MVSQADSLKAMNQAVCDGLRQMYVLGRLRESEVRKALTPDADLRHEYDEAMKLVFALTANVQRLREENDRLRLANWVNERIIQLGCESEKMS